jgi:hypothetical protein
VQPARGRHYNVKVSNNSGSVTSSVAGFTVTPAGALMNGGFENACEGWIATGYQGLGKLPNQAPAAGGTARLQVAVSGSGPTSFQCRRNGADIVGATGPSLAITGVTADHAAAYDVVVANASGSTLSFAAMLIVVPPRISLNGSFEFGSAGWTLAGSVATSPQPLYGFSDGAQIVHVNFAQYASGGTLARRNVSVERWEDLVTWSLLTKLDAARDGAIQFQGDDPPASRGFYRLAPDREAVTKVSHLRF